MFPSPTSIVGHLRETKHLYGRISEADGTKFRFQGMGTYYLAVAERDLLLPSSLSSRLLNRTPIGGIATGRPEDWTLEEHMNLCQHIVNRVQELSQSNTR